jgi:hypothetical protein
VKEIAQEVGRTVREAMQSWPATARLCVLLAVTASGTLSSAPVPGVSAERLRPAVSVMSWPSAAIL